MHVLFICFDGKSEPFYRDNVEASIDDFTRSLPSPFKVNDNSG